MCSFGIRKEGSKPFDSHDLGDQRFDNVKELRVKITFHKNAPELCCFAPPCKHLVQTCPRSGATLRVCEDVGAEELLLQRLGEQKAVCECEKELEVVAAFADGEEQVEQFDRSE
jgi:hypothetical protein